MGFFIQKKRDKSIEEIVADAIKRINGYEAILNNSLYIGHLKPLFTELDTKDSSQKIHALSQELVGIFRRLASEIEENGLISYESKTALRDWLTKKDAHNNQVFGVDNQGESFDALRVQEMQTIASAWATTQNKNTLGDLSELVGGIGVNDHGKSWAHMNKIAGHYSTLQMDAKTILDVLDKLPSKGDISPSTPN